MTAIWAGPAPMRRTENFVGRHREIRLLHAAATGSGLARILVGEVGVGRTALLRHLADIASYRVLWVRGCEAESGLPFAAASEMLVGLGEYFGKLPAAQRRALEVALALAEGPASGALAVYSGALGVLGAAGEHEPLLVLVDDLQWVDPESRRLLLYVGRRLNRERVALVMALREEPGTTADVPDLPVLRLHGLDVADCRRLARSRGLTATEGEVDAVTEATGGNPLALLETLSRAPRREAGGLAIEVGASVRSAWHGVLDRLPEATRRALFVLAAAGPSGLASLDAVLPALGLSLHDLEPAERQELVVADEDVMRLRHPLLGPVLRAATCTATRMAIYRALASAAGPEQKPWYQSLVATGPDDELATRLMGIAQDEGNRARHEAASGLMRRAAELTGATPLRAERLLSAAAAALRSGLAERAVPWCREASSLRPEPEFLATSTALCARALGLAGQHRQAYDELRDAASRVAGRDPVAAAGLLCEATVPAMVMGEARLASEAAAEAELLADGVPLAPRARLQAAAARALHGVVDEVALPSVDELAVDMLSLVQAAAVHLWAERPESARAAVNAAIDQLRRDGAPTVLAVALAVRSDLGYRTGGWAAAYADAVESLDWAEKGTPNGTVAFGLLALARVEAARGHADLCGDWLARCRREAGPYGVDVRLLIEPAVRGLAALGTGEPRTAVESLEAAWAHAFECGLENPNVVPFAADLAEAHARCGNRERALEVVAWMEERAILLRLSGPLAGVWRCRGLLADDAGEAASAFATAQRACDSRTMPFELARTLLCEGEVLRRHRRSAAARSPLRRAVHLFEGLGATSWAERAAAELSASGERDAARLHPVTLETLTPQQLQIARLVAAGHNNVETAEALYLSRKTVEAHLTQVYRKLGVHSRTQLANALPSDG